VVLDATGNLYGTTHCGLVYELSKSAGVWALQSLAIFSYEGGVNGVVFDTKGNLYGVTGFGGAQNMGTVFELSPDGEAWSQKVLYQFSGEDGQNPYGDLIFDTAGNLYGTTEAGGASGAGTVFELMPGTNGTWSEKVLYSFKNNGKDGRGPVAGVIFDKAGNLYGTTIYGGAYTCNSTASDCGTVFELVAGTNGTWTEKVLHSFGDGAKDGYDLESGVIFDEAGNLYGTRFLGGATTCVPSCGTVFELTPRAKGSWTEKILHSFRGTNDGTQPQAGVIFDNKGNLYGTTLGGGSHLGGTAFKLGPHANGTWAETVLHNFGEGSDGYGPQYSLVINRSGNLYGTTCCGGADPTLQGGILFEVTP
jgi:uncharacterized repeat protein (TIGR03803 family)